MNLQDTIFILLSGIVMLGAFGAVFFRNVFFNALSLGLALFGLAGIFIYLNSDFLAAIQVIIYVGAISIAIIFAIMLSQPMWMRQSLPPRLRTFRSLIVSVIFFALICKILLQADWPIGVTSGDYSLSHIGRLLLTQYVLPFEVVSLILLIAIIGALLISGKRNES
ncbi:NADH-quinone oxidoreductase subunit J [Patescibacteria group bacterium]|nr:NADH-quinone oxidoreductase subunit J [Patescibacteria group bacterium]